MLDNDIVGLADAVATDVASSSDHSVKSFGITGVPDGHDAAPVVAGRLCVQLDKELEAGGSAGWKEALAGNALKKAKTATTRYIWKIICKVERGLCSGRLELQNE